MTPAVAAAWSAFCEARGEDLTPRFYEAFHFSDNEEAADELAALVLAGTKRATASLVWSYELEQRRPPRAGDLSVVTNWAGRPVCVMETTRVDVVPFDQVTEEFAATEGEGDGTLAWWREAHWDWIGRECARIGREPTADIPMVCERFRVVHRLDP